MPGLWTGLVSSKCIFSLQCLLQLIFFPSSGSFRDGLVNSPFPEWPCFVSFFFPKLRAALSPSFFNFPIPEDRRKGKKERSITTLGGWSFSHSHLSHFQSKILNSVSPPNTPFASPPFSSTAPPGILSHAACAVSPPVNPWLRSGVFGARNLG